MRSIFQVTFHGEEKNYAMIENECPGTIVRKMSYKTKANLLKGFALLSL